MRAHPHARSARARRTDSAAAPRSRSRVPPRPRPRPPRPMVGAVGRDRASSQARAPPHRAFAAVVRACGGGGHTAAAAARAALPAHGREYDGGARAQAPRTQGGERAVRGYGPAAVLPRTALAPRVRAGQGIPRVLEQPSQGHGPHLPRRQGRAQEEGRRCHGGSTRGCTRRRGGGRGRGRGGSAAHPRGGCRTCPRVWPLKISMP
mmetsp:Transcript_39335/g.92452  ORF Transcript_39335/g.92452 Transcript_39335/m.92452 type:complete len:206 (-) Transcript_39335:119-736(-)